MTIAAIFAEVENAILGTAPDSEAHITFRLGPYDGPLDDLDVERLDAETATRLFQVEEGAGLSHGDANGTSMPFEHFFELHVQYVVDSQNGGWQRLRDLMAEDKDRIVHALRIYPYSKTTSGRWVRITGDARRHKSSRHHILILTLGVYYVLGRSA